MQSIPVISETPTWENIFDISGSVDGYIYDVVDSTTIKVIAIIPDTNKNISIICKLHEATAAKKNKKKLRQLVARKFGKFYFNGVEDGKYLVTCYVDNNNINDYL